MDVFFVISGFLITTILLREFEQGRFSLVCFYERAGRTEIGKIYLFARGAMDATRDNAVVLGPARSGSHGDGNRALFAEGLTRTIDAVSGHVARVVLIEGVPEIGWSDPEVPGRAALHGAQPYPRCPGGPTSSGATAGSTR